MKKKKNYTHVLSEYAAIDSENMVRNKGKNITSVVLNTFVNINVLKYDDY